MDINNDNVKYKIRPYLRVRFVMKLFYSICERIKNKQILV